MTKDVKEEIIVSQKDGEYTVYKSAPNYYEPSEDRKLKFLISGDVKPTYWNYHDYQLLKQPEYEERKEREMESRCLISGKNGKLIRCMGNCSKCDHPRNNYNASLNQLEELGRQFLDEADSPIQKLLNEEMLEKYFTILDSFDERDRKIIIKHIAGCKPTEIARNLSIPQQTVSYRLPILLKKLQEALHDYYYKN